VRNPKIRALVVDDEPLARANVLALLRRDPDIDVVGECGSGTEAISALERQELDLVFLDIQMPECDGFDVLERVGPRLASEVVFVTAHDAFAVQAFEAGALDYLLKPFSDDRFALTLRRIKSRMTARAGTGPERRLFVKDARQISIVRVEDIDWIEAADYYACLHVGSRSHMIRRTISQLERDLDPATFCRIHRSTIVNLRRIESLALNAAGEYDVRLQGGASLHVSRRYRCRVHDRLK